MPHSGFSRKTSDSFVSALIPRLSALRGITRTPDTVTILGVVVQPTSGAVHLMGSLPLASVLDPSMEARPKSATLACPSSDKRTFLAARSRCTTCLDSRYAMPQQVSTANPIWSRLFTCSRTGGLVNSRTRIADKQTHLLTAAGAKVLQQGALAHVLGDEEDLAAAPALAVLYH